MQMMHDGAPPPPSWRGEPSIAASQTDRRETRAWRLRETSMFKTISGQMDSARERGVRGGAQIGRSALPSCRRVCILWLCERDPLCPVPSPLRAAMRPSPLAFAKSCKGGDVSVLDPALAWDLRCIYTPACATAESTKRDSHKQHNELSHMTSDPTIATVGTT